MQTLTAFVVRALPSFTSRLWVAVLLAAFLLTGGVVAADAASSSVKLIPDAPAHSQLLEKGQTSQADQEAASQIESILGL
ncbi:hypothetical protein [Specibacter sp. RAF43]|uniref:hypothetical protein n=1 Tax=Specibacter sp. RAF43 TaxID=3233057 RepID=UPI003F99DC8F